MDERRAVPHITQEQADEFAVGAADADVQRLLMLHLAECDACAALVAESRRVATAFSLGVPVRAAPSRLRKKTFTAAGIARPGPVTLLARYTRAVAGVAAVFVAAGAFTGMILIRDQVDELRDQNAALQSQIDEALSQEVEIAALTHRLAEEERASTELRAAARNDHDLLVAILSPESDIAEVVPVDEKSPGVGRLVWDRVQERVWLVATKLEPLPAGQTYQLWVSSQGEWVSLGTFNADSAGFARYQTFVPQGMESYESALVTIERAGGATERTGPGVFVSDLSRFRR